MRVCTGMEMINVDWHIHTTLSPCGDLSMDPLTVLQKAHQQGLRVIGITDHNSTRQGRLMKSEFSDNHLMILVGAEVTTREEIHCLAFFDDLVALDEFQIYLDRHLPAIDNNPVFFGDQVVVDASGNIVFEEKRLLISALDQSLQQVASFVAERGGIFIPAHINRPSYSLLSQLGIIPDKLIADALEWVPGYKAGPEYSDISGMSSFPIVFSSDAHRPDEIGSKYTSMEIDELTFRGVKQGLTGKLTLAS